MRDDARFFVMMKEVAHVASGYPLRGSADTLDPGDVHFVQLKHMDVDSDIVWSEVPLVTLPSEREPAWLSDSDVIFASRGTRTLAYPLLNTPARAVCAPQFFVLSVKDTNRISPEFLAWQINQRPAQEYFQRAATGAYIQNIRRHVLEELQVSIPPLHEQRLIVGFWRAAQQERAALNRLIENRNNQLEALAVGLLQPTTGVKQ